MNMTVCRFCGERFKIHAIARHVSACGARKALLEAPNAVIAEFHHLQISAAEARFFRLDVLAAPDAGLSDLDDLLRTVWLECCYHMSAFTVAGEQYVWSPDSVEDEEFGGVKLSDLPDVDRIRYVYDLGNSTAITIRRLKSIEHVLGDERVIIAARNDPPEFACACGKNATVLVRDSAHANYLCPSCLPRYDGDVADLTPLTNSPRMGVCAYYRGEADTACDYAGFEEAEAAIDALPGKRDERALESGPADEKEQVIADYLWRLSRPLAGGVGLKAAVVIDRHFEHFAAGLRAIVTGVLSDFRSDRSRKPTNPAHVFALFLLARRPDAELFTIVAEGLSRNDELIHVWNGALYEPRPRRALFASLCRDAPDALVSAIAEHEDDSVVRHGAANALIALHVHGVVDRESIVAAMNMLATRAVYTEDEDLALVVADACMNLYPEDMIRTVQQLARAELLDGTGVDYLDRLRLILDDTMEKHFARVEETGFYQLIEDPMAALEDALVRTESFWRWQSGSAPGSAGKGGASDKVHGTIIRTSRKVGRNEPCPCGSGRKYKHCCGR